MEWVCVIFDKPKDVWQLKWPPLSHPAWNWQPTSLACGVSHNNQILTSQMASA